MILSGIKCVVLAWLCFYASACMAQHIYSINAKCNVIVHPIQSVSTSSFEHQPRQDWQTTTLPHYWESSLSPNQQARWYKILWDLHCEDLSSIDEPVVFALDYLNSAGAVYFNGDLLWKDKHLVEPLSRSWNSPRYWILVPQTIKDRQNEILIYTTGFSFQNPGLGPIGFYNIQQNAQLYAEKIWSKRTIFQVNFIISLIFGILCFVIWLFRRSDTTFAWFSASSFTWLCFSSNILMTETAPLSSSLMAVKVNITFFMLYVLCFSIYILRFTEKYLKNTERIILLVSCLLWIPLSLATAEDIQAIALIIFIGYLGVLAASYVYLIGVALTKQQTEIVLLAGCLSIVVIFVGIDLYLFFKQGAEYHHALTPYSALIMNFFIVVILAMRLSKNIQRVEQFNFTLEQKIDQVTAELKESLRQQHQLELVNARLQERIHLSHDLHDGLGASLTRSMHMIDHSQTHFSNQQFLSILKLLRDDLRQIIDAGSSSAAKIPDNPVLWLASVRRRFVNIMEDMQLKPKWSIPQRWPELYQPTPFEGLTLIRVIEESLTNVIKHSHAKHVEVNLSFESDHLLQLTIMDDGIGFDVDEVITHGMSVGMRSIQLRLQHIGAVFELKSQAGCTALKIKLLLKPQAQMLQAQAS